MTCPKCGTLASRPIVGGGVECSLCMTVYSPERIAALSAAGWTDADMKGAFCSCEVCRDLPQPSYYSLQPEPAERSLLRRLRDACRGALDGWRGA